MHNIYEAYLHRLRRKEESRGKVQLLTKASPYSPVLNFLYCILVESFVLILRLNMYACTYDPQVVTFI